MAMNLIGRSFLTLKDFTPEEIRYMLDLAKELKRLKQAGIKPRNLEGKNIFLYVPTFRDEFERTHHINYSVYDLDFKGIHDALTEKYGGDWMILIKFHPIMQIYIKDYKN